MEQTESNDKIIAEAMVKDGDSILMKKKINFLNKAFVMIKEGLARNTQ